MFIDESHHGDERDGQFFRAVSVLVAYRRDHPSNPLEAETVKVTVTPGVTYLELDDGVLLEFDGEDLRAAIGEAA